MSAQDNLGPQFDVTFTPDYHGRHAVTAWPKGQIGSEYDKPLGSLHWHPKEAYVTVLNVDENHRRQGIATSLWNRANEESSKHGLATPIHSTSRTPAGDAWAPSVGGKLPQRNEDA